MPVEAKPLFRPDVLRAHFDACRLSIKLDHWANLISTGRVDGFKETDILRDCMADFFVGLLGYKRPAHGHDTVTWERHLEVDGSMPTPRWVNFNGQQKNVVAIEGKGPKDPLDRPFAGRAKSAVDQGYR